MLTQEETPAEHRCRHSCCNPFQGNSIRYVGLDKVLSNCTDIQGCICWIHVSEQLSCITLPYLNPLSSMPINSFHIATVHPGLYWGRYDCSCPSGTATHQSNPWSFKEKKSNGIRFWTSLFRLEILIYKPLSPIRFHWHDCIHLLYYWCTGQLTKANITQVCRLN